MSGRSSRRAARIKQFRESLRALLGAGPDDLADDQAGAAAAASGVTLPPTLSYELLARRPDLQAMRWYVQSSFDRIDAAKASFYPSFDIKAFFGVNALHLGDLFTHASQQINLLPGLYLPIFDGGRLNANLGTRGTASNMLIDTIQPGGPERCARCRGDGSRLQDLDDEAKLQAQKIDAVSLCPGKRAGAFRAGLASRLTAMDARAAVLAQRISLLEIDGQRLSQDIAMSKALGGGYRAESPVVLKPR